MLNKLWKLEKNPRDSWVCKGMKYITMMVQIKPDHIPQLVPEIPNNETRTLMIGPGIKVSYSP